MTDTIFALSSGAPPAGIAVIRISGPGAGEALRQLSGRLPQPRRATSVNLRDGEGEVLDRALALWLPGPGTATGEDVAELHCHGGRAVVRAIEAELAGLPGLRRAEAGEFTRRAFANGRIDLAEAEGLADLLSAETELQRRSAMAMAGGAFSRHVEGWRQALLELSGALEAEIDFGDEDDVSGLPADFAERIDALRGDIAAALARPRAEVLREGFRVVLAGPPNAGKSTLFNALVESEAAIATPIPGTTRDVLTRPVGIGGVPFLFVDTAGLRAEDEADAIEAIGIGRARGELERADLVLWLGPEGEGPEGALEIDAQVDRPGHQGKRQPDHRVSAVTGEGMAALRSALVARARSAMPRPGEAALNARQARLLADAELVLGQAAAGGDLLITAENLRLARVAFDALLGRAATEDMLDVLFSQFCIGK